MYNISIKSIMKNYKLLSLYLTDPIAIGPNKKVFNISNGYSFFILRSSFPMRSFLSLESNATINHLLLQNRARHKRTHPLPAHRTTHAPKKPLSRIQKRILSEHLSVWGASSIPVSHIRVVCCRLCLQVGR